jgi:hypothetical protein
MVALHPFAGVRVEIVSDDDRLADPRIPKDVLAQLGPDDVLTNGVMMYVRASLWRRLKNRFATVPTSNKGPF